MLWIWVHIGLWLSVWLWLPGRQTTNGTLWRLQIRCVSLENTLRLLSYASCVLCMCWIKYLSHLSSFAHCAVAEIWPKWRYEWPFLLLLVLIVLLKDPVELINESWALTFFLLEVLVAYIEGFITYFCKQPGWFQVVLGEGHSHSREHLIGQKCSRMSQDFLLCFAERIWLFILNVYFI